MNVVIVTSQEKGIASLVLPYLVSSDHTHLTGVILLDSSINKKSISYFWLKFKKILKYGLTVVPVGFYLRHWYRYDCESILALSKKYGVSVAVFPHVNSEGVKAYLRELSPDLGLSLGNGYIEEDVFTIPELGMINVHMELLPEYKGARSLIWNIYNKDINSGFTIHKINNKIDGGGILLQNTMPIEFCRTLRKTIVLNFNKIRNDAPKAIVSLLDNYHDSKVIDITGRVSRYYTTPSLWQFIRMVRNNRFFYKKIIE